MKIHDHLIASRILKGDARAFGNLIDMFKSRVFNYCLRMTNNYQESEDLTQEVFLKLYKNMASYDWNKSALSTWIYSITRNTCLNYARDQEAKKVKTIEISQVNAGIRDGNQYRFVEERMLLFQVLNSLTLNERELIIMKDYLDLTYKEIGLILGLPIGTVKTRVHVIRSRLRQMLKEGDMR